MQSIFKFTICLALIFCFAFILSSCDNNKKQNQKITINDVNYSSLSEAVENAKNGDVIKIHKDVRDNKNINITKPLTIKGISSSNETKPKVYGSLSINLTGETDAILIENIHLIHNGTTENGLNNDTSIGINLVDGGLSLKYSYIELFDTQLSDDSATGLSISRKSNSINTKPIIISGNDFSNYPIKDSNISSAIVIKSNQKDTFENLLINNEEIFEKNNFSTKDLSNQYISIDYSSIPETYSFFSTTSIDEFIEAIKNNQNPNKSIFYLFANSEQTLNKTFDTPIEVYSNSSIHIIGDSKLNFNDLTLNISGNMEYEPEISNITINKSSSTANIIKKG